MNETLWELFCPGQYTLEDMMESLTGGKDRLLSVLTWIANTDIMFLDLSVFMAPRLSLKLSSLTT